MKRKTKNRNQNVKRFKSHLLIINRIIFSYAFPFMYETGLVDTLPAKHRINIKQVIDKIINILFS
jgi:hypothetical protein